MSDPSELDRLKLERAAAAAAGEEEEAKPTRVAIEPDQQRRGFALTATPLLLHLINLVGTGENVWNILLVFRLPMQSAHLIFCGEGRAAEKIPCFPSSSVE